MRNDGWRYYNQALMPDVPPHIQANLSAMNEKDFWKSGGVFLFLLVGLHIGIVTMRQIGGT